MAYAYSQMMGTGLAIVAKQRKSATEVEGINLVGDVKDCNTVLVDDLTTTAGTLCMAAKLVREHGAKGVLAAVTHAPITEQGIERLKKSGITELVTTDTIPQKDWHGYPVHILSVAELLGEAIHRIHNDQSVSTLFKVH